MASEIRKSVVEELIFAKFNFIAFAQSDFLALIKYNVWDLANCVFLNLANFAMVDKFLICLPILLLLVPLALFDIF